MSHIQQSVMDYYEARGLVIPDTWQALAWAHTELGEAYEYLLADGAWVRNNPYLHPTEFDKRRFAAELGDAIMMLVVAGWSVGYDPIELLLDKMARKGADR